jgi:hypothetical protein
MSTVFGPKGALLGSTLLAGLANDIIQYRGVKRGADADHGVKATANSVNLGIAVDNQDNINRSFPIAHRPGELVTAQSGAAVAIDSLLTTDATGRLVVATTGQNAFAVAREAATLADQLFTVELIAARLAP